LGESRLCSAPRWPRIRLIIWPFSLEIEAFDQNGNNVALASEGATASQSSGNGFKISDARKRLAILKRIRRRNSTVLGSYGLAGNAEGSLHAMLSEVNVFDYEMTVKCNLCRK
jgi:hypothetical protein